MSEERGRYSLLDEMTEMEPEKPAPMTILAGGSVSSGRSAGGENCTRWEGGLTYPPPPYAPRTYPAGGVVDCRTADQKIAGEIADMQTALRLLVAEVAALRRKVAAVRRGDEPAGAEGGADGE